MSLKPDEVTDRLIRLAEGVYVEHDVLGIVQRIYEYDRNLRVKYLDPQRAEFGDAPYKIVEECMDGQERVIFDCWELNELVLERLYAADTMKNDILAQLDAKNALARIHQQQRYQDQRLEAQDIVKHFIKSPKGRYSFKNSFDDSVTVLSDSEPARKK